MRQNQGLETDFAYAKDGANANLADIMGGYHNFLNSPGSNQNFGAYGGYQDFANTGGYSGQDIQDLRARAIDPIRGVYSRAQSELDRNRALQGGYSPNYAAASSKMTRQLAHEVGDANVNVNASLADQIRQGKLAGLGGMTNIDSARMQEGLANRGMNLNALSGMTSAYSASPGMLNTILSALLQSNNQRLGVEQLNSQNANNRVNSTIGMTQVPGNFQSAMGNLSSALNVGGQVGSMFTGGTIPGLTSRSTAPTWGQLPSGGGGISY
jgi:hypothetical protein